MKDRIFDLIQSRPEFQFSRDSAGEKVKSLFGNTNEFGIGMGIGNKLGEQPAFMNIRSRFGMSRFMRQKMGGVV
jgi:hypothetical protein